MDWNRLLNANRLGEVRPTISHHDVRSEFERDADRVIYSGPFRRLSRKTQVHPLAPNDHIHNRLTHSLETGQVGRALAKGACRQFEDKLPKGVTAADVGSIVQAACLAHDIGNPAFGHAGEEAMTAWFKTHADELSGLSDAERHDIGSFDGNAQGFRIVSQIENYIFKGGMRLTYATLATFLKYPNHASPIDKKFSVFHAEKSILDEVAREVGVPLTNERYVRHPLAYLVEAADDICYCVLDLEDAVELDILDFEEVVDIMLKAVDSESAGAMKERLGDRDKKMFRVHFARIRGLLFASLIDAALEGFKIGYPDFMQGHPKPSVFDLLASGDPRAEFISRSKREGRTRIYVDAKKVEVELGAFATLDTLLSEFFNAARERAAELGGGPQVSWKTKLIMQLMGDHAPTRANAPSPMGWTPYQCYRRAIDYVSGCTDNYATYLAKQLRGDAFTGGQRP
jgi:dGTPase